jgi:hypothetical protein
MAMKEPDQCNPQILGFMQQYPLDLIDQVTLRINEGMTQEQVDYFADKALSEPVIAMAFLWAYTPPEAMPLRTSLLRFLMPTAKEAMNVQYRISEVCQSIPGQGTSKEVVTIFHRKLWNLSDQLRMALHADLLKLRAVSSPDWASAVGFKNKSVAEIRRIVEGIETERVSTPEPGVTVTDSGFFDFRSENPTRITKKLIETTEKVELTSLIEVSNASESKQWEYRAVEWLTDTYKRFQDHQSLANRLLRDSGWNEGKPFFNWVIIRCPNRPDVKFSLSLAGKLEGLFMRALGSCLQEMHKTGQDREDFGSQLKIHLIDTFKDWNSEVVKEQHRLLPPRRGSDIDLGKGYILGLLHKAALQMPESYDKIVGLYRSMAGFASKDLYSGKYLWGSKQDPQGITSTDGFQVQGIGKAHKELSDWELETYASDVRDRLKLEDIENPEDELLGIRLVFQRLPRELDPVDQGIVELFLHGDNQVDIARKLGISAPAVNKRIRGLSPHIPKDYHPETRTPKNPRRN